MPNMQSRILTQEEVKSAGSLKKAYLKLLVKLHPDSHPEDERELRERQIKRLQAEYKPESIQEQIAELNKLTGIEIELCGSWLWLGGDTKKHRKILKNLGCKWSKKKERWYWAEGLSKKPKKGKYDMPTIYRKFG